MQETVDVVRVGNLAGLEGEGRAVRHPAGDLRCERSPQLGMHVQVSRARPAAQPFHRAPDGKVHVECRDVERHGARRLVDVKHDPCANRVRLVDHGLRILDVGALEEHVRDGHEQGLLVNRGEQAFGVYGDAVLAWHLD